ncbi:MAG: hypothetical protein NC210_05395 [[Clostridium] fimetarium]|nr:hypothetical protein [Alistipes timonensis]MCM1405842.1 hypothetical protein [[Clostridium] fimetarium]
MRLNITHLLAITIIALCGSTGTAQTRFKLDKKNGHYYISTTVNGVPDTEIFVESGLPGMMLDEVRFKRILGDLPLDTLGAHREMLMSDQANHRLINVFEGEVSIGGLRYNGKIYLVDNYDKLGVPIHRLKNNTDSTANLIRLNFKSDMLDFVSRDSIDGKRTHVYQITNFSPMPIIETTMELADTYGHNGKLTGRMVFDLGAGTAVYLFRKNVTNFLKKHKFKVAKAKDKVTGKVVGEGIFAGSCKLGDRTIYGTSVGITNRLWREDSFGCVGTKFFKNGTIAIDPDNMRLLYWE